MEQPFIQLDGPEEQVLDSNKQFEQSEHSGRQLWTLKSEADSLDWLADFSTPVNSLQPPDDLPASAEAPEIFGDACEEDQFISMTTVDSSEESRSWLSSLENNSELDHQMAEASMASMTSFELTATEQAEQATEVDEPESRRHSNAFPFHSQTSSSSVSDVDRDSNADSISSSGPNSSVGFISDILDGVVFTPIGASELPRPSPDTRCRSSLSSFRPPEADEESTANNPSTSSAAPTSKQLESLKALRAKSPPPSDLETLFQRELAAKIKKRCLENQLRQLEANSGNNNSSPLSRSIQSALPPIPKPIENPVTTTTPAAAPIESCGGQFENPLYQTLDECFSGSPTPPPPPPLPATNQEEEATYAVINEANSSHYQTVISGALVTEQEEEEEERVYAQVADDQFYDTTKSEIVSDSDAIYENLEEIQEQTYANIRSPPPDCITRSANVLTALVLDVDAAAAASASSSSTSRCSNSSSSGNSSSSPQQSSSSPEQLSPTDSLANVSVGSVRSINSPDSGVFGLLKPASFSVQTETLVIQVKTDTSSSTQNDLLDRTLKQFERLEQLSTGIFENSPKQSSKMEDSAMLLTPSGQEKVSDSGTTLEPVVLEATVEHKNVPISEIPIEQILQLAGSIQPSETDSATPLDPEDETEPPVMPMSPPPSNLFQILEPINNDQDVFQASLVSVDSQGSSMTTSSMVSVQKEVSDLSEPETPVFRSPEPKANLGAKIVEDQVKRMQELEHARNQKLGLVDVGVSFDKLSSSRYDVIDQMKPKTAKRKEWLSPAKNNTDQESTIDLQDEPLDGIRRSSGVNSESILVKKEETKAFWEGKMQSESEEIVPLTNGRNQRIKMEKQLQRQPMALSPPPGFDNDFFDGGQIEEPNLNEEPSLSNLEFIDVGLITFKSDPNSDSKPFVIFGSFEDSHIDANIENELTAPAPAPIGLTAPASSVQVEKPRKMIDQRPKSLYFEPDRDSSSSDDNEAEPESPHSFSGSKGGISIINCHPNPTETLIEREIRLQREREEAVLRERQKALEILEATRKQSKVPEAAPRKSLMAESNKKDVYKPTVSTQQQQTEIVVSKKSAVETKKSSSEVVVSPAEIRISEEIRELKRREEELRQLREAQNNNARNNSDDPSSFTTSGVTDDEGLYSDAERDVSSSEANSSRVESPEAGINIVNEYSKFPHQRTQSMDSMSSGHSSGDHVPISSSTETAKRNQTRASKTVMPLQDLSDQDETPPYLSRSKETPIEREIRLGREREEALRREKGLQQPIGGVAASTTKPNEKESRQGQRLVNGGNDKRDVQHRYATSIIQREMNEIAERENELVRDGKIQTTSVERADSKVSSLGDYTKKKSVSAGPVKSVTAVHSHHTVELALQRSESVNEGRESPSETKKTPQMRVTYGNRGFGNNATTTTASGSAVPAAPATWRAFSNPQGTQRGLMEKFFMSRGRLNSPATFNSPSPSPVPIISSSSTSQSVVTPGSSAGDPVGVINHSKPAPAPVRYLPPAVKPVELQAIRRDEDEDQLREKAGPPRRHYATTEEKIQQEFREMQKREEELKLNRSKFFAKSQPNLLDMDEGISEPEQRLGGQLRSAHSISDLLADESQPAEMREDLPPMSSSSTVKGARRKSALIAQWENRIHQQDF